jgi:broad specificity phosphatase PhoE
LEGRRQGHDDSLLTHLGQEQAHAAGEALRQVGVDAIYTSPLGRAATTAGIVAALLNLPVRTVDLAREIDHGAFTGLTNAEIEACYPGALAQRDADKYTWTFPDGESYADAARRASRLVDVLGVTPSDAPLIVTHEMFARMLVARISNARPQDFLSWHLSHGSFVVVHIAPHSRHESAGR